MFSQVTVYFHVENFFSQECYRLYLIVCACVCFCFVLCCVFFGNLVLLKRNLTLILILLQAIYFNFGIFSPPEAFRLSFDPQYLKFHSDGCVQLCLFFHWPWSALVVPFTLHIPISLELWGIFFDTVSLIKFSYFLSLVSCNSVSPCLDQLA